MSVCFESEKVCFNLLVMTSFHKKAQTVGTHSSYHFLLNFHDLQIKTNERVKVLSEANHIIHEV